MKRLLNIAAMLAIFAGFTACEEKPTPTPPSNEDKDTVVELKADKESIIANGVDEVAFTVLVDSVDRTSECKIIELNTNEYLAGNTFTATEEGTYTFKAVWDNSHTSEVVTITATAANEEPVAPKLVFLAADKTSIVADGVDSVTFSVLADDVDVTSEATIVYVIDGSPIEGNTYTTTTAGTATFMAVYKDVESNEISIVATEPSNPDDGKSLKLTASTSRIKADGTESVTFTVLYGEDDVTASSTITNTADNTTVVNATFSTTKAGDYTFRAEYDGKTSESVIVTAYNATTQGGYAPGDVYDENGVKGIVYAIKQDNHGVTYCYIMSLDEEDLQWSTEFAWCNCISNCGDWNTEDMLRFGTNPDKYPAAQWCQAHGEGWFMPSADEIEWMWEAITDGQRDFKAPSVAKYNQLLVENGGEPFCETFYWTSNETTEELVTVIAFMNDSVVCLEPYKDRVYTVRAAYRFKVE